MFELITKTIEGNDKVKISNRRRAEELAEMYYECDNVYAVEIISSMTGELLYYKAKG